MGASTSTLSSPSGTKLEGTQDTIQGLTRLTGLEEDSIKYIYKEIMKEEKQGEELLRVAKISKDRFTEYLSAKNPTLTKLPSFLYKLVRNFTLLEELDMASGFLEDGSLTFRTILCFISILLGKYSSIMPNTRSRLILESLSKEKQTIEKDSFVDPEFSSTDFCDLIGILYSLFLYNFEVANHTYESSSKIAKIEQYSPELTSFIFKDSSNLPVSQIQKFMDTQLPRWVELLESFVTYNFMDSNEENPTPKPSFFNHDFAPIVNNPPTFFTTKDLFHLIMSISPCHKKGRELDNINIPVWDQLYSSTEHGFSINRFETHVLKYPGPTLLLLRGVLNLESSNKEIVMAVYLEEAWKKSKYSWGGKNTRVFELSPFFECFISSDQRQEHVLFNKQQGICFGPSKPASSSTPGIFLLDIDSSLQTATYAGWMPFLECPAFKPSPYRNSPSECFTTGKKVPFDIDDIIVFGLGGEPARKRQNAEWKFEEADATRRANISAINNPHDPANRQILEMAGIVSDENPSIYRATHQGS